MKRSPIEIFSEWVTLGKADGMEENHKSSVLNMLDFALKEREDFTFIDAGCGTGWVVRMVSKMESCFSANGVDGSVKMIEKAKSIDNINKYDCSDLSVWKPNSKKDVVMSMEVMYYFEDPLRIIQNIFDNWLDSGGVFIMGIDYYLENKSSHDWPEKTNVSIMNLLSQKEWEKILIQSGLKKVRSWRHGNNEEWEGTLILTGTKN
ncbi:MAG: class I SAM-dependent methyltransferase [Flavobacteriaceae bacterium]